VCRIYGDPKQSRWLSAGKADCKPGSAAMSGGLAGTGRVADDLYLMAHHEASGRSFVQPRALGIGLAGALLAELMLADSICSRPDGVLVPGPTDPGDALARRVQGLLVGERHPVRDWLLFMARTAAEEVACRLEQSGYLMRPGGRRPWRSGRWVPVDPDWAFSPLVRVRSALDTARPVSAHGTVLAGLADGCGLGFRLAQYVPPADRRLDGALGHLHPALQELIAQVHAAVGSSLLSHRR
jgi:Golgi phosphoprotein 3 GPP34